ncbi:DegT/DnrJ/EryC1/StrS family aminotransferase [Candidatus Woesearchaeota archaeon]|nr:DegT/DnrJ/EryC1/StrS family aminotransferase [Candidatus Woesearchaeota archaeon]
MDPKFQLEFKEKCIKLLQSMTGHENVRIVDSGDMAIFFSLYIAKQQGKTRVVVPDQGGWLTYRTYPKILDMDIVEVKTKDALLDLDDLRNKADGLSVLIMPSFGGYFVQQPMEGISGICREAGCILIEDASGAIGDEFLCNGALSDVLIGSFGRWKVVDLGYGGFISVKDKGLFEGAKDIFSLSSFFPQYIELYQKLQRARERIEMLMERCGMVKDDLQDFDIIHRDSRSLVVVVALHLEADREKIISYCSEKKLEFTECPRYIRVGRPAISIEVKRLS